MKNMMYRKIFSNLTFAIILSAVIRKAFFSSAVYFSFLLVFFSFSNLLISWLYYLKLDGFTSSASENILNFLSKDAIPKTQSFWFSRRRIDKNENDEFVHLDINPRQYTKLTMLCYLISGITLLIISFFFYKI